MKYLFLIVMCFALLFGCEQPEAVDREAEGEKIMAASREWAKSEKAEDYLKFWTEDALVMSPGQPTYRGHGEISEMLRESESIPGFQVDWEPQEVYVSESGDLAYLIEKSAFSMDDSTGNKLTEYHKAVTIWKKQEDGSWKCVVDIMNPDPSISSLR